MSTALMDIRLEEQVRDEEDYALNEGYYKEIKQYARQLGLQAQIDLADEHLRKLHRPRILSPWLSKKELLIWQRFLPTSYRGSPTKAVSGSTHLQNYRFDLMPKHIYEQWVEWDKSMAFDEFEIRTEEVSLDPALFGIRGRKYWLLARWGASDEALISFEEIKKILREQLVSDRRFWAIVAAVFGTAASLFFFGPAITVLRGKPPNNLFMALPATFVLIFAIVCWKHRDEKIWSAVNDGK
jgi:hypothetical protein